MKTLKRILASTTLILAIGVPLYAGDIHMPAAVPTPSPAVSSNCDETTSDEIQVESTDATLSTEPKALESEFAVDLLLALLSFF